MSHPMPVSSMIFYFTKVACSFLSVLVICEGL